MTRSFAQRDREEAVARRKLEAEQQGGPGDTTPKAEENGAE